MDELARMHLPVPDKTFPAAHIGAEIGTQGAGKLCDIVIIFFCVSWQRNRQISFAGR